MSEKDTVTDTKKINEVLDKCETIHLGLRDGERVYVVPVHYGYEEDNGQYTFYFHGRPMGRRSDLLKKTHYAGFEIDSGQEFKPASDNVACNFSASYASVIGEGKVEFVNDREEKITAFKPLMKQYTGRTDFEFPAKSTDYVQVYKLTVTDMCCRIHKAE